MDTAAGRRGGHQAAPDRPRDLHPLQHLRGDLPGRRDHARRPQLRRQRRHLQPAAWPASRRARPARSTTGARCRERSAYPIEEQLQLGRAAARADAPSSSRPRACAADARSRRPSRCSPSRSSRDGRGAVQRVGIRRDRAAVVGRARLHQPVRPEAADHGDGGRQLRVHRGRLRQRDAPHRARLRRDAVPGARRPVDRHRAAGRRRAAAGRTRAPVLDRKPAQRRAAGLQQRRR